MSVCVVFQQPTPVCPLGKNWKPLTYSASVSPQRPIKAYYHESAKGRILTDDFISSKGSGSHNKNTINLVIYIIDIYFLTILDDGKKAHDELFV